MTVRVLKTKGYTRIQCEFRAMSGTSMLVHNGECTLWIPLAEIEDPPVEDLRRAQYGDRIEILIPEWVARERGLE